MYTPLSNVLNDMNWLNPFDYYDLIVALIKLFGKIQSGIGIKLINLFMDGFKYGTTVVPHHHPLLLSLIIFLYFFVYIFVLACLCIIAGIALCLTNMFSAWIMMLSIYIIFWRNPKLIEFHTIVFVSAFFFILDMFNLW